MSRLMSISCQIDKHNFGHYSRSSTTGNVIVMREDRKPLGVEYVGILCHWIMHDLRPLFKKARAEWIQLKRGLRKSDPSTRKQRAIRERVVRRITKQSLLEYGRGRLRDEDTESTEDEVMENIIKNGDETDGEMPEVDESM
jgi:hypothetical protein